MSKKIDDTQLWKITDKNGQSYNHTQWGWGVTHTSQKNQKRVNLCTETAIHAYIDPVLGVFLNPIHGNYDVNTMLMWEAEGWIMANDGTKVGCRELTTWNTVEFEIPNPTQKRAFAILCALEVEREWRGKDKWVQWAEKWLNGEDRTEKSREDASTYAYGSASTYVSAYASAYASASTSTYVSAYAYAYVYAYVYAYDYNYKLRQLAPSIARQAIAIR